MKTTHIALILASPVLFVACENPADKTTSATVSEAVETAASGSAEGTKYVFTPESKILFTGSKVTGSHTGGFETFTGQFFVKDGAPGSGEHTVSIDLNSTFSDNEKLTEHLKSADFFEVETYPTATFKATGFDKVADNRYTVSGNFSLHGVEKNISFPATITQDGETIRLDAKFDINRKDFGIVYAGKADDLIRDEVVIELKLEAKPEA